MTLPASRSIPDILWPRKIRKQPLRLSWHSSENLDGLPAPDREDFVSKRWTIYREFELWSRPPHWISATLRLLIPETCQGRHRNAEWHFVPVAAWQRSIVMVLP